MTIKAFPASCRCGGSFAWMVGCWERPGEPGEAWEMVGCVCHTPLWAVQIYELLVAIEEREVKEEYHGDD